MFKNLYWAAMLVLLMFLPGISIIMFVLYLGWELISTLFCGANRQQSSSVPQGVATAEFVEKSVQSPSPHGELKIAENSARFASQIELEHDEQQRFETENISRHTESIVETDEFSSWRDQLEEYARR